MKKIVGLMLLLFVISASNVFADDYDYNDGLLDQPEIFDVMDLDSRHYDNDLNTNTSVAGFNRLVFKNLYNIDQMYISTGGYGRANVTFTYYDEQSNSIQSIEYNQNTGYHDINIDNVKEIRRTDNTYAMSIKEIDFFGSLSEVVPIDDVPPSEITNLETNLSTDDVLFSWSNPDDEDFSHVNIYRDGKLIKSDYEKSEFRDTDLIQGETYNYKITTLDELLNESDGNNVSVTFEFDSDGDGIPDHEDEYPEDPTNTQPPETIEDVPEVQNLKIEAIPDRVDLTWDKPPKYFDKATIYRKKTGTATSLNISNLNPFKANKVYAAEDYEPLFETNGTSFADLSVKENESYIYKVTNTYGGMESSGVTVNTTIPKPPLIDTSKMKLDFGVTDLIKSGNGLLGLVGGFVLLALSFVFVPKIIATIRKSFINKTATANRRRG